MLTVAKWASRLGNVVIIMGIIALLLNFTIPVISAHLFLIAVITIIATIIEVLSTHDESEDINGQRA